MSKLQRIYTLTVQGRSGAFYELAYPLTLQFDMELQAGSGVNRAHFMVYNLSPATRNDIQFDSTIDITQGGDLLRRLVVFKAGYQSEGPLPIVFQGNIQCAFYYRDGPDVVTDIVVQDGLDAIQKAMVGYSVDGPWDPKKEATVLAKLMAENGVTLGAVGTLFDRFKPTRGAAFFGAVWDQLKSLAVASNGCASIYLEKIYLMGQSDGVVYPGELPQIDATTGLIGTPRRSGWNVQAQMLFEPTLRLWQLVRLFSTVNPTLNSVRRVDSLGHRGIISGAKDGGAITSLNLFLSPSNFNQVVAQ